MPDPHSAAETLTLKGTPASPGIAIGQVYLHVKHAPNIVERPIQAANVQAEIERLNAALQRSEKELTKIHQFALQKLGKDSAGIIEAQIMIVQDAYLREAIVKRITTELRNAEPIIFDEIGKYCALIQNSNSEFSAERAQEVEDVCNRILRNLQEQRLVSRLDQPFVIVASQLSPADALIFTRNDVLAYCTDIGGVTSHTAILSRALKIPAVVALHDFSTKAHTGDSVIVDGYSGTVILHPTEAHKETYRKKQQRYRDFESRLAGIAPLPAETPDGHRVTLHANIEFHEEIAEAKAQGAEGIGLYRSEVLLYRRDDFPSEDEQFEVYDTLSREAYPLPAVIRTFDIGGDKLMPVHTVREKNPFLGWRGIRVMLEREDVFMDQLRAILRASHRKNIQLMIPMVTSVNEVRRTKALLERAKEELRARHVPFDDQMPVGAMVEVPAAAVIAEDLAKEVQFLSIGSNDLIQYVLAVDRTNDLVAHLYKEYHPSVIRFIRRIIERGVQKDVWVGMCGEMAGNPLTTILLLGLGLQKFSVSPFMLTEIKKIIRLVHYTEAQEVARRTLTMETSEEIQEYLTTILRTKFPDIPLE